MHNHFDTITQSEDSSQTERQRYRQESHTISVNTSRRAQQKHCKICKKMNSQMVEITEIELHSDEAT